MPACKDLTNQQFNYLTVLEKTEKRKNGGVVWLCKCKCGNLKEVTTADLKANRVMSCGCYNKEQISKNYNNLLGQHFGKLTVIEKTEKRSSNRSIIWKCKCDCGNITEIASDSLLRKNGVKSCGCIQKEKFIKNNINRGKDLTNQKFGKLTPIELISHNPRIWKCKCDCGNFCNVSSQNLLSNHTSSCGCLTGSKGELKIKEILQNNNIPFISQYHIKECKFKDTNYPAYFDFYVNNKYIIEFDGKQHFSPSTFGKLSLEEAEKNFQKTQKHDKIKNQWCKDNNIPLIRIPYTHYNKLCLKDLLLETSKFIVQSEKNND